MPKPKDEFMDALYEQIDNRITEMNDPDYEYVNPMTNKDWVLVLIIGICCLIMICAGYFLM